MPAETGFSVPLYHSLCTVKSKDGTRWTGLLFLRHNNSYFTAGFDLLVLTNMLIWESMWICLTLFDSLYNCKKLERCLWIRLIFCHLLSLKPMVILIYRPYFSCVTTSPFILGNPRGAKKSPQSTFDKSGGMNVGTRGTKKTNLTCLSEQKICRVIIPDNKIETPVESSLHLCGISTFFLNGGPSVWTWV